MDKVVKKIIPLSEVEYYFATCFGEGLEKDLHSNEKYTEKICERCHGTGLVLYDNRYGLESERPTHAAAMFPYTHQILAACPDCYNGVVKICNYCGNKLQRFMLVCNCKTQKKLEEAQRKAAEMDRLAAIPEASEKEIADTEMFYSESYPYNEGYFSDFEEFFDAWSDNYEPDDEKPEFCFGTDSAGFHIDAESIVEDACEDLYEDAFEDCSNIRELQDAIDAWAAKNGPGDSYCYHKRFKIRIPWEQYEES